MPPAPSGFRTVYGPMRDNGATMAVSRCVLRVRRLDDTPHG
jgi:hypothetical protein